MNPDEINGEDPYKAIVDTIKSIVNINNSMKRTGNPRAHHDIGSDPKKWTQSDMNALANYLGTFEYYYGLLALTTAGDQTVDGKEDGKPTPKAIRARKILEDFFGRPYDDVANMIGIASLPWADNPEQLVQRRDASKKSNVDGVVFYLKKDEWTKLDVKKLTTLATTLKDGRLDENALLNLELLKNLSARTAETDFNNKTTKAALYAQTQLGTLAADGKWQTLVKDIKTVKAIVGKKQAEEKKKFGNSLILDGNQDQAMLLDAQGVSLANDGPAIDRIEAERVFAEKVKEKKELTGDALEERAYAVVKQLRSRNT